MNIKYTPYLVFYKEERNYVWNRDLQPDASTQFTITHDIDQAQLFDTREDAMKALRKFLYTLCPKKLITQEGILIAQETHLGYVFIEENEDVRLDVSLFDVKVIPKKKHRKSNKKHVNESKALREYYIGELMKYCIYEEEWLTKQSLSDLRWLKENYWKRHFVEDPKEPVLGLNEVTS
jgi:hypothetical protein